MADEPEVKEDPAPVKEVVPLKDPDKVDQLLDILLKTKDMPSLSAIRQACMEELAQINAELAEAQAEAQEAYQKALAEWEAKKEAERKAKAKEELAAKKKAEEERKVKEEEAGRDPNAPQTYAGVPSDTQAQPLERRV